MRSMRRGGRHGHSARRPGQGDHAAAGPRWLPTRPPGLSARRCIARSWGSGRSPAAKAADGHLKGHGGNVDKAIHDMIESHVRLAGVQGFVTNIGGLVTAGVTIPANIAGLTLLQCRMVAGIAHLRGYDIHDARTRNAILACMLGEEEIEALVKAKKLPAPPMALATAPAHDPTSDKTIANTVAATILTRIAGKRLATTVSRRIPLLGGLVGAGADGYATWRIGRYADRELLPAPGTDLPTLSCQDRTARQTGQADTGSVPPGSVPPAQSHLLNPTCSIPPGALALVQRVEPVAIGGVIVLEAGELVPAAGPTEPVVAGPGSEEVVAPAAVHPVRTLRPVYEVVSGTAPDHVSARVRQHPQPEPAGEGPTVDAVVPEPRPDLDEHRAAPEAPGDPAAHRDAPAHLLPPAVPVNPAEPLGAPVPVAQAVRAREVADHEAAVLLPRDVDEAEPRHPDERLVLDVAHPRITRAEIHRWQVEVPDCAPRTGTGTQGHPQSERDASREDRPNHMVLLSTGSGACSNLSLVEATAREAPPCGQVPLAALPS